jgi:hypothetical protein
MEVGRLLDISAGTKRMGQNQAEVNAHPSQIAFGIPNAAPGDLPL